MNQSLSLHGDNYDSLNSLFIGEEMVVVSFDIVYEKWGWLLIFWNFAGVPFLYCASSVYLYKLYA
jgi:delta24(24(1))-sterol reductase